MNKYESVIIIKPDIGEDLIHQTVEKYKKMVEGFSDKKVKVDELGEKKLAYEFMGCKTGYYGVFYYNSEPENIAELERNFRIDDNVMKFMTVRQEENVYDEDIEDEEDEEEY